MHHIISKGICYGRGVNNFLSNSIPPSKVFCSVYLENGNRRGLE